MVYCRGRSLFLTITVAIDPKKHTLLLGFRCCLHISATTPIQCEGKGVLFVVPLH